jgi:protein-L-isoaspartate O-methyltransferase
MHDEALAREREDLLDAIRQEARLTARWTGRDSFSAAVMRAIGSVPREKFVPGHLRRHAYL